MGCAQSRIDNEESVSRCKERRNLMKEAVSSRNAFASAHTAYSMALKNTGAALSDYSHGESLQNYQNAISSSSNNNNLDPAIAPPPPPLDSLPPPPPPLPEFSPSPLQRSSTMPAMPVKKPELRRPPEPVPIAEEEEEEEEGRGRLRNGGGEKVDNLRRPPRRRNESKGGVAVEKVEASPPRTPQPPESKGMAWDYFFMVDNMPGPSLDNDNDEIVNDVDANGSIGYGGMENSNNGGGVGSSFNGGVEPKTPEKVVEEKVVVEEEEEDNRVVKGGGERQIEHSKTAPAEFRRAVKAVSSVNLMKVMSDIDDHFLKASESAHEVSKMLEATRLHYHSNFADNRGGFS